MLSLTKKTEYALIAMRYLAERATQTVSAREIAETFGMPGALIMNILKTLHHAELLSSTRGTKGGYRLTADLAKISVYDLIAVLEGPVKLVECSMTDGQQTPAEERSCKIGLGCPIQAPIQALHSRMVGFLREVKLSDVLANGHHIDVPAELVGAGACNHACHAVEA